MKKLRGIITWAVWIAGAVALAFFVNRFVVINAKVVSGSMESTIMTGDRVVGNRMSYLFGEPKRFDVVALLWPDNPDEVPFVKRIIGLPGETVEIVEGRIYINGNEMPLDESFFLTEEMVGCYGPYYVEDGTYFVLGDNRNRSSDSRDWEITFVPLGNILGKVILRLYPALHIIQ